MKNGERLALAAVTGLAVLGVNACSSTATETEAPSIVHSSGLYDELGSMNNKGGMFTVHGSTYEEDIPIPFEYFNEDLTLKSGNIIGSGQNIRLDLTKLELVSLTIPTNPQGLVVFIDTSLTVGFDKVNGMWETFVTTSTPTKKLTETLVSGNTITKYTAANNKTLEYKNFTQADQIQNLVATSLGAVILSVGGNSPNLAG